jgi:hypothetical protein
MPYEISKEGSLICKQLKRAKEDLQKAITAKDKGLIEYFAEEVDSWTDSLRQLPAINWLGLCQD